MSLPSSTTAPDQILVAVSVKNLVAALEPITRMLLHLFLRNSTCLCTSVVVRDRTLLSLVSQGKQSEAKFEAAKEILMQREGRAYFQVQDDYLDSYCAPDWKDWN